MYICNRHTTVRWEKVTGNPIRIETMRTSVKVTFYLIQRDGADRNIDAPESAPENVLKIVALMRNNPKITFSQVDSRNNKTTTRKQYSKADRP